MIAPKDFLDSFNALPQGYSEGCFENRPFRVSRTDYATGKVEKLWAEDLSGNDHVSFNLYHLKDGSAHLKPCEMTPEKVITFVMGYKVNSA